MVKNRLLRHTLFILSIVGIVAITPHVTEAHIEIERLVNVNEINLSVSPTVNEKPLRITIPSRGINIKVEESAVENGTWAVPEHSAGYAGGSALLDEEHGNSIIFAHARNGLFRDLLGIRDSDEITVIGTENIYKYKVTSIEKILPDEIDKIKSFGGHNLTLFTCEGWNDEYRLLVKAKRIDTYSLNSSEII